MRSLLAFCRGVARIGLLAGILLIPAFIPKPVCAADPAPPSWADVTAERQRLGKQFQELVAAGKKDEAAAVVEKLVAVDRSALTRRAATDAEKKAQQEARQELIEGLQSLVDQKVAREDWSAAAVRQRELADILAAIYGKADYRSVDARNDQAYFERLSSLRPEEVRQIVKANRSSAKVVELYRQGKYQEAIAILQDVIEIQRRLLGEESPRLAVGLNNLAQLYSAQGDYARAEPILHQALEIGKKAVGENHPWYAQGLNSLALLYYYRGDYARAEPLYWQALEVTKKAVGEHDPDYANGLNNLAGLYDSLGDYARAERLYRKAIEIRKNTLGENHPDYADALNNLALLYYGEGDYARAEPLYRLACEIYKKALGENHPGYAISLNNLAGLYDSQGDYARAEPMYRKAAEIQKKALGENHPDYAASLNNLATMYDTQGEYARAEPLYRKVLKIWEKTVGDKHPQYAQSLNNLAELYRAQGEYARAEPLYGKAMDIRKKALGEHHPNYAQSLNNLALLYEAQGNYARAEALYKKAQEIWKKVFGENHPDYATSLSNLALLYEVQGDYVRAEPLLRQAVAIQFNHLEATAVIQSERQQLAMLNSLRYYLNHYLALTIHSCQFPILAYQQMLAWKGIVFRREKLFRAGGQEPELAPLFQQLQQVAGQLAREAWATPDPGQLTRWRGNMARLSAEKERLEAELSARSATYRHAKRRITLEEVQQALSTDTALVDFLEYRHYAASDKNLAVIANPEKRFVAFVVRHDGPVVQLNLGPAKPISDAIATWRETFGASPQSAAAGRRLREKIWEPIEAQLKDARTVLLSPDGALSRLPFGALPGKRVNSYLIEDYTLAIVPTAQMIPEIVSNEARKALPKNLLLLGNIDYDGLPEKPIQARSGPKKFGRDLPQGLSHFAPLPATRGEVATIEKLYRRDFGTEGILTLEERRATKAAFLAEAGRHRYLHLATHGFFVEETLPTPAVGTRRGGSDRFGEMLRGPQAAELHVGLLSGLALAGANQSGKADSGEASAGDNNSANDNGILTAEEIGAQNLGGVQLVVLSACETGLGKAAGGEGLLGLQRAFQAAGARTVVASLWKVPDTATRDLMEHFYENHWQKNLGLLAALREAQLSMLREGGKRGLDFSPGQAPDKDQRLPPYYWAAFILSGDWR